jgi:hypothetical protein
LTGVGLRSGFGASSAGAAAGVRPPRVGPLAIERLEEALDLAVPARRVGGRADVTRADPLELGQKQP